MGVTGLAVLCASFLLVLGAETAEKDVPRAFAIAVQFSCVAVALEYLSTPATNGKQARPVRGH
ncbi:Na+/Ca2+-exchanging protein [Natrinema limicola JCM 13563]|uniref:Na+/Ca2+-exchanging protein n=1 Tax=Natrinema limicola JCM 13563 TaxID=1230457 RepID=M0CM86_9EURY|nr:Na+/Ca2+-exchanging protein [Natrinema limicola JCM 13563]